MERHCGQYSVTNCQNVGAMLGCRCDVGLSVRCWVVGAMLGCRSVRCFCRPSKVDDQCVDLRRSARRSVCRPSKMDDRCADLRRWMIDVPTFEDRWSM